MLLLDLYAGVLDDLAPAFNISAHPHTEILGRAAECGGAGLEQRLSDIGSLENGGNFTTQQLNNRRRCFCRHKHTDHRSKFITRQSGLRYRRQARYQRTAFGITEPAPVNITCTSPATNAFTAGCVPR